MDEFWSARLPASRKGTRWLQVLQTLVAYRLIDPGSEWRLHRHWFTSSAMADLLDADFALAGKDTLYRCLDKLLPHKDALMLFLKQRWGELFGASFDVLLYDLTSTYFESDTPREAPDKRQYGYSRDKRGDCRQVVIGLIVTPEGFPLSYEVLPGNTGATQRAASRHASSNRSSSVRRSPPPPAHVVMNGATNGATAAPGTASQMTLIRGADLVAAPWKNSGGITREVAAYPQGAGLDTFVWPQNGLVRILPPVILRSSPQPAATVLRRISPES
jgi:hypothetical protein